MVVEKLKVIVGDGTGRIGYGCEYDCEIFGHRVWRTLRRYSQGFLRMVGDSVRLE